MFGAISTHIPCLHGLGLFVFSTSRICVKRPSSLDSLSSVFVTFEPSLRGALSNIPALVGLALFVLAVPILLFVRRL